MNNSEAFQGLETGNLTQLLDQRKALQGDVDRTQLAIKELDKEILALMYASELKSAVGSDGTGVKLHSSAKYEYQRPAYEYLNAKGLIDYFTPEPKITQTKLNELKEKELLTFEDLAVIEKHTIKEESPYTLAKYTPKEARII